MKCTQWVEFVLKGNEYCSCVAYLNYVTNAKTKKKNKTLKILKLNSDIRVCSCLLRCLCDYCSKEI